MAKQIEAKQIECPTSMAKQIECPTTKHPRIASEHAKSMTTIAVTLLDVVPIVFPDHMLLKQLKSERNALRKAFLTRYWRDNGPWALWRAIEFHNRIIALCKCAECADRRNSPLAVRSWDSLKHYMTCCGLSYVLILNDSQEEFDQAAVSFKTCIRFDVTPKQSRTAFPIPAGFDRMTACPGMAPVSHVKEAHIVFTSFKNNMGVTYGRKLWEKVDGPYNSEILKLDLLLARLRTIDSMAQATHEVL
jgi:hypothetical protein